MRRAAIIGLALALVACGLAVAKKKHHHGKLPRGPYPSLGACSAFPKSSAAANAPSAADESAWNQDISQAPLDPNSAGYIAYINAHGGDSVHPDFGSPPEYGFPYAVVGKKQKRTKVHFTAYGDESDHGAYRVPLKALVEGGQASDGDRHVLAVDRKRCKLYELYRAFAQKRPKPHWNADGGVIWNLRSAALRTDGFTSADAAGLPIFPGPGPLRRGRLGPHRPRAARHRQLDPGRLDPPRLPLRRIGKRPERPADGAAPAPLGRLRHLRVHRPGARDRRRAQAVRADRRRQRLELVHLRDLRPPLAGREPRPAQVDPGCGLPGRAKCRSRAPLLTTESGELTIRTPMKASSRPITAPSWSGWPRNAAPPIAVVAGTR